MYGDLYAITTNIDAYARQWLPWDIRSRSSVAKNNGPSFFNFAVNLPILQNIFVKMIVNPKVDTLAQATQSEAVSALYQQMTTLPPEAQMFMEGCSSELEEIRHRINCRELVTRRVLALSSDVEKILCWNLGNEKVDRLNLMHLLFDKHKLVNYENGVFKQPYPAAETFRRMINAFGDVEHVRRIVLPEYPAIYSRRQRYERDPLFVIWEKRDAFSGEDIPSIPLSFKWPTSHAHAMDVFGGAIPTQVINRHLHLSVSHTPVFIETQVACSPE